MKYIIIILCLMMFLLIGCESAQKEKDVDVVTGAAPIICEDEILLEERGVVYKAADKMLKCGMQKVFELNPNAFAYVINILADD